MARNVTRVVFLALAVFAGLFGYNFYEGNTREAKLQQELLAERQRADALAQKNEALKVVVKRLQTQKRVAKIYVVDQKKTDDGRTETTLLFTEYARDGKTLLPNAREITIDGVGAHLDAYVIQFDGKYVEENDPLRGHSVALFKRVFGDNQPPNQAFNLDTPGDIPEAYRASGVDPKLAPLEKELWKDFWRLADDKAYRDSMGVKLAYGSGAFREVMKKHQTYTLTLDPQGGLRMVNEE